MPTMGERSGVVTEPSAGAPPTELTRPAASTVHEPVDAGATPTVAPAARAPVASGSNRDVMRTTAATTARRTSWSSTRSTRPLRAVRVESAPAGGGAGWEPVSGYLVVLLVALGVTVASTPAVRWLAHRPGVVQAPDE